VTLIPLSEDSQKRKCGQRAACRALEIAMVKRKRGHMVIADTRTHTTIIVVSRLPRKRQSIEQGKKSVEQRALPPKKNRICPAP